MLTSRAADSSTSFVPTILLPVTLMSRPLLTVTPSAEIELPTL
ncbi:hypothetical protein FEP58_04143 [Burkholderia multivorans]|nr:hypothetical protein [Burkholderia multivorans]